jgi:peptide/nickel transport system substrate-binding protein
MNSLVGTRFVRRGFAVALAFVFVTALFAASAVGRPSAGGTLRVAVAPDLSMDPPNAASLTDLTVLHTIYQTLVNYDWSKGTVTPGLAQKWTVSKDGLVYTFNLNPKARFSSGNPVLAADVVYSLNRVFKFTTAAQGFQIAPYLTGKNVTASAPRTVRITLTAPAPAFLTALTGHASSILDSKVVQSHESGDDLARPWLAENTAGSGPYVLSRWAKDSNLLMTRNTKYWGPRPSLDAVLLQYVQSPSQAISMLRGGDLDVIPGVLPAEAATLKKQGYKLITGQRLNNFYLTLPLMPNSPFVKPKVRTAVRYAIDYKGIINGVYKGYAVQVNGVIAKGMLGYDEKLNSMYKQDLPKARTLLAEAGYPNGFSIDMYYQSDVQVLGVPEDTMAAKIQADLARVGIKITLHGEPSATVFPKYRARQLPMVYWNFGPSYPDPDAIMYPHGNWNAQATTRTYWRSNRVSLMIDKARLEPDVKKRAALYKQASRIVAVEGPYAFLFRPKEITVARKGVKFPWIPIWTVEFDKAALP